MVSIRRASLILPKQYQAGAPNGHVFPVQRFEIRSRLVSRREAPAVPFVCLLPLLHCAVHLRIGVLPGLHLITKQIEQEQRAQAAARAFGAAARGHHIGRDAHAFFADHLQRLDQRDALRAERVDLFAISHALRPANQPHLLGLGLAGLQDVARFALGLGLALFGATAGDFDADRRLHQALLVVGVRFGLLQLDALLFGLALGVVHTLSLFC